MDEKDQKQPGVVDMVKDAVGRLRVPIAAAAFLLALVFVWDAWHQGSASRAESTVAAEGARLQDVEKGVLSDLVTNFEHACAAPEVVKAVAEGDAAQAANAFESRWADGKDVSFISPDLDTAFANPDKFGYGRIAVLSSALQDGVTRVAVARVEGKPTLAIAGAIKLGGEVKSLALVVLPIDGLRDPIASAHPGNGYLALHFHGYEVATNGDSHVALLGKVSDFKLLDSGFAIQTASPQPVASMFGVKPMFGYVLAVLFALAGSALLRFGKMLEAVRAEGAVSGQEATLADMLSAEPPPERKIEVRDPAKRAAVAIAREIFRAYDIRGVVGQSLDAGVAKLIGQAIGSAMQDQGLRDIVVGRDGRTSGPEMANALIEGLRAAGREVIDIGMAPTPLCYFAAFQLRTGSCVAVTGSHNPPDYNGFKIVLGGDTLAGDAILALYERIAEDKLYKASAIGGLQQRDVAADYIQRIAEDVQLERKLKVVVDAGNGVAGIVAPEVLQAIGCEVLPIFCEVDGTFPNHHPDPSEPRNLADAIQMVQRLGADIGIAFDGDGDRLGVVTRAGEIIYPDRLLMLFASDVLERNPGACIVYDVKCTGHLAGHILRHGGSPLMWKTGHSLIKAKMKETGAELAGEMSGHFFFKERWYGFDDGIYAAARLLEILAARDEDADAVFAELPKGFSTPELKAPMAEGESYGFVDKFRERAKFEGARVATIDGVRADWPDGWGLVRASNTTPVLVMRFDADSPAALER
ncbi:MAG TPA: phosphomannomutase/phosphoglucomutase, partial [Xanthomonadaceae bacterium]|nr:phosphomannomutase/phosphoglucomutase [Xanthomonadaceae bacterium]